MQKDKLLHEWACTRMWLNLSPEHSPSSQQGLAHSSTLECFCLFVEKIVGTLSECQARQHMQNLLPRYLFVSILHNLKFEFATKQAQKHSENIWGHTQLFHSVSETSSIVPQRRCISLQVCTRALTFYLPKERLLQADWNDICCLMQREIKLWNH